MTLGELIAKRAGNIIRLEGFDEDTLVLANLEAAGIFEDDLEDIFFEMGVEAFDDEEWINADYTMAAVSGEIEDGEIVQAHAFFIFSKESNRVHVLELAPTDAKGISNLPVFAEDLAAFDALMS